MHSYKMMTQDELRTLQRELQAQYDDLKRMGLKLDMSRGKPAADQLALSMPMLDLVTSRDICLSEGGVDCRNYGELLGIPEMRKLFAELFGVRPEEVMVGSTSSLTLMFDAVARAMKNGVYGGSKPWGEQGTIKFLCPVPGYDRHFAITQHFGIEMVNIPMDDNGPDMDLVEELVASDASIKGIWCVPRFSNPEGTVYSDEVVRRFARLQPKADDFRIFWDNAYFVHTLADDAPELLNLMAEAEKAGTQDRVFLFSSTSKVTFPGGGISVLIMSEANMEHELKAITIQSMGGDKVNQLRHARFLKNAEGVRAHMAQQADKLRPKFALVEEMLERELGGLDIAWWTHPKGGYFVGFHAMPGCAKRIYQLCKEAGVALTPAGATYPYGNDPEDSHIRLAPTYPPIDELRGALEVLCVCTRLAAVEKLLAD